MPRVKLVREVQSLPVTSMKGRYMSLYPITPKQKESIHMSKTSLITLCNVSVSQGAEFEGYLNEVNCTKCLRVYNQKIKKQGRK